MFTRSDLYYIIAVVTTLLIPLKVDRDTFVKIQQPMAVVTHKNYPPYLAHVEATQDRNLDVDPLRTVKTFQLTLDNIEPAKKMVPQFQLQPTKMVLDEIKLSKSELASFTVPNKDEISTKLLVSTKEDTNFNPEHEEIGFSSRGKDSEESAADDGEWRKELTYQQRLRLELAEQRSDVIASAARASFSNSGLFQKQNSERNSARAEPNREPKSKKQDFDQDSQDDLGRHVAKAVEKELDPENPAYVSGYRPSFSKSNLDSDQPQEINKYRKITGAVELSEGLAVTHEHSIVIRRYSDGVYQERGQINLQEGTYSLTLSDFEGSIAAQLTDKNGQVLGEGFARISHLPKDSAVVRGPKIVLAKRKYIYGSTYSQYSVNTKNPIENSETKMFHSTEKLTKNKDQKIDDQRLAYGSKTLLSAQAKNFYPTQKIVTSGEVFNLPLLPSKMVQSLREIVSDQKQSDYNDPEGTLVWGQVTVDGKPLAGVTVEIESSSEAEPIYFNEFFLPDSNLKTTSTNGYFAFIQVSEGLHSLVAKRGSQYLSHDNVIVERGIASLSDIKTSINTKPTTFKVFDAFNGMAVDSRLEIQSLKEIVATQRGVYQAYLPDFHRLSLIQVPGMPGYQEATYTFDDKNEQVFIPLINEGWLLSIRNQLRINDVANSGTVVGFVNDENFELYTAIEDPNIVKVYFDSKGQVVSNTHGVAGGGFIIFNIPVQSNEVIVYGDKSQKFYSQVIGINNNQLNVLSYKSDF